MQFTMQKQQLKEYRRLIKEDCMTLVGQILKTSFMYACGCLVILAPTLTLTLGWIKS